MTTTLQILQKSRTLECIDRDGFSLGETYDPCILAGISGASLESLCIFIFEPVSGDLISGAFNSPLDPSHREITKVVDRYHATINFLSPSAVALFAQSQEPRDVVVVVRDANIVFCKATVKLSYVPDVSAGDEPTGTALLAAFQFHNQDTEAHLPLVACSQIPDLTLDANDDNLNFATVVANFNALIAALRTPRA